jgi:sensor histidine kinase YesM
MKFYQELLSKTKILLLVLFFLQNCFPQQYPSRHITVKEGLPDKSIYSILKDSNGILWLGTLNGLVSISGNKTQNFKTAQGLPHNSCWQLVEDKYNNIWIGTFGGGLSCYNGKSFETFDTKKGLANNLVRKLFINDTKLYIGTHDGVSILDLKTHEIISIKSKNEKLQIMDFFEYQKKIYFTTFSHGSYELINNKFKKVNFDNAIILSSYKSKDTLYISRDALLYGNKALQKIAVRDFINNKNELKISFSNTDYWNYTTDTSNTILAAAYGVSNPTGGLFEIKNNKAERLNDYYGIESNDIWSIYHDKSTNQLFVGTLDNGLYIIDLNKKIKFSKKLNVIDYQWNSLFGKIILDNEGLQINNNINLKITSSEFLNFLKKNISESNKRWENYVGRLIPETVNYTVFKLVAFKVFKEEIFVNSNLGLFKIKRINNQLKIINYYPFFASNFFFGKDNSFLFQFPYDEFFTIKELNTAVNVNSITAKNKGLKGIIEVLETKKNTYYISQFSGLFTVKTNQYVSFLDTKIFTEKELKSACKISEEEFIVSNLNGDVFLVKDSDKISIKRIINNEEIVGKSIYFLHYYDNKIIIITEKGVNIYNRKNKQIKFIDEEQGIDFNRLTKSFLYNNFLLLVSEKGTYDVDLIDLFKSKKPKVKIASFKANDIEINTQKKEINLEYNQNKIDLILDFSFHVFPKKVFYRFKVNGLRNSKWSEWTQNPSISIPFLPAGKYVLLLEVKDLSSGNNYDFKIATFGIKTPFWKTLPFYILIIITLIVAFILFYKVRIKLIKKRQAEKSLIEKRIVETKLEALQSQMNPHFVFNSMNAIHHYIISNDVDSSLNYINDFTKLMRTTLNNSSQTLISLKNELNFIKLYVKIQNNRFENSVDFNITIDATIETSYCSIPPMLLQPIVENCFEHAFNHSVLGNTIDVNISENTDFLLIDIIDNGKGFDVANIKKESKGISLLRERLALLDRSNELLMVSIPYEKTKISLILNKNALIVNLK